MGLVIADDLKSVIYDGEAASAITYTSPAGVVTVTKGIPGPEDTAIDDSEHGETEISRRDITIITDAVYGIAEPEINGTIVIAGDARTWEITDVKDKRLGKATLAVIAHRHVSKYHEGYKHKVK